MPETLIQTVMNRTTNILHMQKLILLSYKIKSKKYIISELTEFDEILLNCTLIALSERQIAFF